MLRTAIPVVAVMLALLTGVGTKAPDRPFPIYPRPGGAPPAAGAKVKPRRHTGPRPASTTAAHASPLQVYLNP